MPRFSIVIPVYNTAPYLAECLDSVLSQTIVDFEVLAIDDGSTDSSAQILDEYAVKDARIHVTHIPNRGVSAARNLGIEQAQGEYLCFVDADDVITSNYLEALHSAMREEADSAMGGFQILKDGKFGIYVVSEQCKIETLEENLAEFYDYQLPQWQHFLWNRIFRTTVIRDKHLHFREDIYYKEDGLFVVQYLCASNGRVGCTDQIVYYYRVNPTGAMSTIYHDFQPKMVTDLLAHKCIIDAMNERGVSLSLIAKAKAQAKSVANWIQVSLRGQRLHNFIYTIKTERLMVVILGKTEYMNWRLNRLFRLWK